MAQTGEVHINPVTGERAVVRVSPKDSADGLMVADLYTLTGQVLVVPPGVAHGCHAKWS